MTKQVQRRRGTDTQHTGFTGAEGEISVNTTNKSVHVHDGSTAGGFEAARADLNNVTTANTASKLSGGTVSSLTVTSADINGGTIDGTTIGGSTPAAGSFTNVSVTGTVDGRDVAADGTKLDGIEASADVTDTANVTAAGALMDSELTDIASVKALDQGVATTDSPSFAGITATTADINGGTIDGVTIGGASAGAGTFNALTVDGGTTNRVASFISTDANALIEFADDTTTNRPAIGAEGNDMTFSTNGEKVRIDSSGSALFGTTSTSSAEDGVRIRGDALGLVTITRNGNRPLLINRRTSDGDIIEFQKDGSTVGSIGVDVNGSRLYIGNSQASNVSAGLICVGDGGIYPYDAFAETNADDQIDLGTTFARFKDLYLSGGVYLGGTGSDNYLDDYEKGNWTPGFSSAFLEGAFASATAFSGISGRYVRVGQVCHCWATITNITGASGNLVGDDNFSITKSSLPFTIESGGSLDHLSGTITAYEAIGSGSNASGTIIPLSGQTVIVVQFTAISNTVSSTAAQYLIQFTYRID